MITIWKFTFPISDSFTLSLPVGAKFLHLAVQDTVPCMWFLVDSTARTVERRFQLRGTGHDCAGLGDRQHLGSFMLHGGSLVFHLFDDESGDRLTELEDDVESLHRAVRFLENGPDSY